MIMVRWRDNRLRRFGTKRRENGTGGIRNVSCVFSFPILPLKGIYKMGRRVLFLFLK